MANTDGLPSSDPAASEELDSILSGNDAPPGEEAADDNGQEGDQLTLEQEAEQLKEAAYDVRDRYQEVKNARQPKPETEPSASPEAPSAPTEAPPPAPTPPAVEGAASEAAGSTTGTAGGGTTAGATEGATAGAETATASEAAAKSTAGRIAAGRAQVQALKQAAIAKGRQAAANMAVKKGITGAIGRVGTALLSEAMIPVIGWIMAAATLLWLAIKTKLGRAILLTIIILPLLPAIFFGLTFLAVGGVITANTPVQHQRTELAGAFAGDVFQTFQVNQRIIDSEINRYGVMKENLTKFGGGPADAPAKVDGIVTDLKALKKIEGKAQRNEAITALVAKKRALEGTLPFNEWLAKSAEELLSQPPGTCPIAPGANPNLGCASFVSYAMIRASIPQSHAAATITIWKNPNLSVVVPNIRQYQANYYEQSKQSLKRGDIIWWGHGICGRNRRQAPGGLHCHIGVYIGNDQAIHNSSSRAVDTGGISPIKTSATYRKDFNGAKRYAPTP